MAISGWSRPESPFHAGELAIQARLGVQEQIDRQGRHIIREFLTEQHRQFFAQLSYVIVGTVDAAGSPWASLLVGNSGFLSSPDQLTLQVTTQPLFGDPLATTLADGIEMGLLGIDLQTRRRNRVSGVVSTTRANGFDLKVRQCFGNCPQYIQARKAELSQLNLAEPKLVFPIECLGEIEQEIIAASDTFFIATAYQTESVGSPTGSTAPPSTGVDVSHRGGKPGFVRVDRDSHGTSAAAYRLTVPDFPGNHHFNTLGNLGLNPRAGLLFVNFDRGDLLYLTGTAEVIWEGAEILAYEGAERLLRFQLEHGYRVPGSLPLRWSAPEFSPFLNLMGSWP
jgi:predicted pyridoxine 5'-phosphate oxidase superfamily flavin-nucleotide-binding protein